MLVHDDADFSITVELSLAHFITLNRVVKEIPYLRNHLPGQLWAYLNGQMQYSCMQEHLPKVCVLLKCL